MVKPKPSETARPGKRRWGLWGLLSACLFVLIAIGWYGLGGRKPLETIDAKETQAPVDLRHPSLVFSSPFLNVRPEVAYVGDESCAACHGKISESYRAHPMGRSLAKVAHAGKVEQFGEPSHSSFVSGPFTFRAEARGEALFHGETLKDGEGKRIAEISQELAWVIGSGARGRSYLINHDGFLFQSPLAWYTETNRWDLSPQYEKANLHFSRPITAECLFCHCNQASPVDGAVNRYGAKGQPVFSHEAIGCERCHGPGELHTAKQTSSPTVMQGDRTIANPRHMNHRLREDVCWQCHLQSAERVVRRGREWFDFRPGLPLDAFLRDYLKTDTEESALEFVGAVPQMLQSRCYLESEGESKLGCISCHDPHGLPVAAERESFYRQRCLACHEQRQRPCNLPLVQRKEKNDSCIACHMPGTPSKFPHLSITDHRVPRKPLPSGAKALVSRKQSEDMPLKVIGALLGEPVSESDRDLGIALIAQADKRSLGAAKNLARLALPRLKPVCAADPDDVAARYAQAKALWYLEQKAEALKAFETLLDRFPNEENVLYNAAVLAAQTGAPVRAVAWSNRLVKLNPWRWEYFQIQAQSLALIRDRSGAEAATRAALKLHPAALLTMRPAGAPAGRKK